MSMPAGSVAEIKTSKNHTKGWVLEFCPPLFFFFFDIRLVVLLLLLK